MVGGAHSWVTRPFAAVTPVHPEEYEVPPHQFLTYDLQSDDVHVAS